MTSLIKHFHRKHQVLIGEGRSSYDTLRPLAYSTLADLVHHMRAKLDMKQLGNIIFLFSRNIHDPSLPLTIQTTSVRLLLNLVDNIFHNKDPEKDKGRDLLVRILYTLVNKFKTLKTYGISLPLSLSLSHIHTTPTHKQIHRQRGETTDTMERSQTNST